MVEESCVLFMKNSDYVVVFIFNLILVFCVMSLLMGKMVCEFCVDLFFKILNVVLVV